MPGRYEKQKPKKKKKSSAGRVALTVILTLVVLVLVLAIAAYAYFRSMLSKVNYVEMPTLETSATEETADTTATVTETTAETTEATTVETTRPAMTSDDIINVLVIGQASRDGESSKLADSMILVSLNTYTDTVTLTSILRDSFVKMADYGTHTCGRVKMTSVYAEAYTWGGTGMAMLETNLTLEENFGIEVDYDVEIDFEQFINMIDYLGGVEIELTESEAEYLNADTVYVKTPVTAGVNRLDGMAALCFARMRKAEGDSDSDIKRTERQRRLINALIEQFRYASILDLNSLLSDCILPFITTNMDADTITSLTLQCLPLLANLTVESGTCPYEGSYWGDYPVDIYGNGEQHSVLRFDQNANIKHMRAITEGETE